jgi:N utilization substance protein B
MGRDTTSASRHKAREVALQVLYAVDQAEGSGRRRDTAQLPAQEHHVEAPAFEPTPPGTPEQIFDSVAEHFEMAAGARVFAHELALEAHARRSEVDALVTAHARNWRIERMAVVDRNILRLATYELRFTDTPTAVVLDEAVNLARRFGDDPSPAFVNGILDAIAQDVRPSAS